MSKTNGAVLLGREMRVRISPQHRKSLEGLARVHGWKSETDLAESLLADAIERAATNTMRQMVGGIVCSHWCNARVA